VTTPSPEIPQRKRRRNSIPKEDRPACWTWSAPTAAGLERTRLWLIREHERGIFADGRSYEPHTDTVRWTYMALWHRDRCAICGIKVDDRHTRRDHDHDTMLFRGFLCPSCNTREGLTENHPLFVNYRLCNPAIMFNIKKVYGHRSAWVPELVPWHLLPEREAA
jgi:Recombination endonuclease VII